MPVSFVRGQASPPRRLNRSLHGNGSASDLAEGKIRVAWRGCGRLERCSWLFPKEVGLAEGQLQRHDYLLHVRLHARIFVPIEMQPLQRQFGNGRAHLI
jgi:hypothetical protein